MKKIVICSIGFLIAGISFGAERAPSTMTLPSAYFLLNKYPDNYHALVKVHQHFEDLAMPHMAGIAGDYLTLLYPYTDLSATNLVKMTEREPFTPTQEVSQKLIDRAVNLNDTAELLQLEVETLKRIEKDADDPNWLVLLAQNLNAREEYSRAAMVLRRITLTQPGQWDHVKNYLFILEKCELYNAGIKEVARLNRYHDEEDLFRRFAMVFARESQRFEQGIALGSNWSVRFPKDPEAWIFLGEMKFAKHELREAYTAYARASQLPGKDPEVYFQLSRISYQLNEHHEAAAWLKRYREKVGADNFIKKLLESEMAGNMEFLDLLK